MSNLSDYWMRMARRATADLAEAERRISSLTMQLKDEKNGEPSRVEDFIKFGRALAERWPTMGLSNYESRREAISIIWHELEQHLGMELSPIYECSSCSQTEWTAGAGPEEASVVESGECPYCGESLEKIL